MLNTKNEQLAAKAIEFIEKYKDHYTQWELDFLLKNTLNMNDPRIPDVLRQISVEVEALEEKNNMYKKFINVLEENFEIDRDILEIGGGVVPSLSKLISLKQNHGTITVYDPRLILSVPHKENVILKKEKFQLNSSIGTARMIIGFMPCDATNLIVDVACQNNLDFMIALCEGGSRKGYEWIEEDDEWIEHVKYKASREIEYRDMGTLATVSLEEYGNPYPIIYNKKRNLNI